MAIRPVVIQISTRSLLTALSTLLITAQLPVLANEPAVRGWEAAPPAPAISLEKQAARKDELRLLPMTAVLDTATPNQNPRSVVSPMIAHPEGEAAEGQPEVTPHAITISRKDVLIQAGAGHHSADKFSKMELSGSATIEVTHDTISNTINSLVEAAVARNSNMQRLDHAFCRYKTRKEKVAAQVANALNWAILSRGDNPSSEAGDVILGEKLKLKSRGSAEYARQKEIDETHLKIVNAVTDICMGLGTKDSKQAQESINKGTDALSKLVGDETAEQCLSQLRQISQNLNLPSSMYSSEVWGVQEQQARCNFAIDAAAQTDPVIMEIKRIVNKYNHHSKLYLASSRFMKVTLSLGGLSPTMVSPISQVALLAYVMATGGPEEDKLMKELYLSKRLDSRAQLLSAKAQLAIEKYQLAKLTHNPMLLVCSHSILRSMTSDAVAQKVLSGKLDEDKLSSAVVPN